MAKMPTRGYVKTRLTPPFTAAEATALYAAMLDDIVRRLRRAAHVHIHVAVAPSVCERGRFPGAWDVFPQRAGDLGDRLAAAVQHVRAHGARRVVAIGVDSPTVPWTYLRRACTLLLRTDVVLGPTEDGGCYAIGLRTEHTQLFSAIAWGTARVREQLMARAARLGLSARQLPRWYDVDTIDDVRRHWQSLTTTRCAPQTRHWLRRQEASLA